MNIEQTAPQIREIAARLGHGWRYNEVLMCSNRHRGAHVLSNGSGLIIEVKNVYGESLPQWQLCYKHPKHKEHYPVVVSIGCSLVKSTGSIIADVQNRLLSEAGAAYKKLAEETGKLLKAHQKKEAERVQFEAFQRVANITRPDCYSSYNYRIEDRDGHQLGKLGYHDDRDQWNMDLYNLSAECVIKVLALLEIEKEI